GGVAAAEPGEEKGEEKESGVGSHFCLREMTPDSRPLCFPQVQQATKPPCRRSFEPPCGPRPALPPESASVHPSSGWPGDRQRRRTVHPCLHPATRLAPPGPDPGPPPHGRRVPGGRLKPDTGE